MVLLPIGKPVQEMFRFFTIKSLATNLPYGDEYRFRILSILLNYPGFPARKILEDEGVDYDDIMNKMTKYRGLNTELLVLEKQIGNDKIPKLVRQELLERQRRMCINIPLINYELDRAWIVLISQTSLRNIPLPSNAIFQAIYRPKVPFRKEERHVYAGEPQLDESGKQMMGGF